jgi:uncharacterized protein (DUF342 family)
VDFNVGNIQFDGNVIVTGNVIEGFKVSATGDVDIGGIVDEASIVAGGSIRIAGGVTSHHHTSLCAGGDIRARYLNRVDAQAGRHICIERQIRNSTILCGASVLVQRGGIVGGRIRAAGPIQAVSFGSARFVSTYLEAGAGLVATLGFGTEQASMRDLLRQIERLQADIGGLINRPENVARLNKTQRGRFTRRERELKKAREEVDKLQAAVVEDRDAANDEVVVVVTREAFPNTKIQIGNSYFKHLEKHMSGEHAFYVDDEMGLIVALRR